MIEPPYGPCKPAFRRTTSLKKFLFARKTTCPTTGCWNYTGVTDRDGYASVGGKSQFARQYGKWRLHQLSYVRFNTVWNGPLKEGQCVLHRCDNRRCFNPAHLYAGDHKQNSADAKSRNRTLKGERNSKAKLTEADVLALRSRAASGEGMRELANEFGVGYMTVNNAVNRVTWNHI